MPKQEPTTIDVLNAVNTLAKTVDTLAETFAKSQRQNEQRFTALETKTDAIFQAVNEFATNTERRLQTLEERTINMEAVMVTKEYLDEKVADLRGDLVVLVRKEDTKVKTLVDILQKKQLLSPDEAQQILTMEPFAQLRPGMA